MVYIATRVCCYKLEKANACTFFLQVLQRDEFFATQIQDGIGDNGSRASLIPPAGQHQDRNVAMSSFGPDDFVSHDDALKQTLRLKNLTLAEIEISQKWLVLTN